MDDGASQASVYEPSADSPAVAKGGLDAPPVAVGPFLNGALPSRTPSGTPDASSWTVATAFPNIDVGSPLVVASNAAEDRLYVGSRDGLIIAFDNRDDVIGSQVFLDLRDRVAVPHEGGFLGLVFHPDFGQVGSPQRNSFYVYYSSHCPIDASLDSVDLGACNDNYPRDPVGGFFNVYLRLSRFEVNDGTTTVDPNSEQVLLNFRLYDSRHRGGGLGITSDGLLYLSIGDQGRPNSAQEIDDNFNGSALRLAVNIVDQGDGTWICPPSSHQPTRIFGPNNADETSGRYYCIPDDNPWLGNGFLEEYCAIGLRNPFRLGIDPLTDRVWVGDVGESSREEVDVIECGNNYGWPFREGTGPGIFGPPTSYIGALTDPVIDFPRNEAGSIIGGYVYRGATFPELYGRYLAGDFVTNRIWAITLDESTMTATKSYLTNFTPGSLVTWGQDNDGEVFMGDLWRGGLHRLERVGEPPGDAPSLLSQTGAFSNLSTATPSSFWVPYGINQPFWSDGASKYRFIALPNDGTRDSTAEKIGFSATGNWTYPIGTVLMKHFELPLDETDPSVTTRLETRFLVLGDDGVWYGLTYRWRAGQTEADLLAADETASYTIDLSGGGTRNQTWYFPSRLDCLRCHRQGSGGALGLRTHQLNGDFTYSTTGRTDNQLRTWNDLGMFSPALSDTSIPSLPMAPGYADVTAPLQNRARSWVDSNCAYCHRPGEIDAGFDARYTTPFASQGFLWTPVRNDLGDPNTVVIYPGDPNLSALWLRSAAVGPIAMPPLAKALAEEPAVDLLADWIERLPSSSPNAAPSLTNPGTRSNRPGDTVALALSATDPNGDPLYFDARGLPAGLRVNHDTGLISGTFAGTGTRTVTASASDGPLVSVVSFEWRVASSACGDGTVDAGEECDDGNTINGDGCTSACVNEFCGDGVVNDGGAETCEPPNTATCNASCRARTPVCGDGFKTPPEQCEDGNTVNGDGCTATCVEEFCGDNVVNDVTETCEPPNTATCNGSCQPRTAVCGDSFRTPPEECEDGNTVNGDGCTSTCVLEFCGDRVVNNDGAETCEPPGTATCDLECQARTAVCGDGFVVSPEQCDDGNTTPGDGCNASCRFEFCGDGVVNDGGAETCEPPNTATCNGSCRVRTPVCGDGFVTAPEECEDGNATAGDGCNASCRFEFCGDGVVNDDGAETCEPPGTATCNDSCRARAPVCGDGLVTPPEECDDRNLINGDGCSSACTAEVPPACGDGTVDPGEGCDDGNLANGDGCTANCAVERCGDSVVNNGGVEECDPPGTATCNDSCQVRAPLCGDGFRTPPEQCDDSNTSNGDGCSSSCLTERCGDGVVNNGGAEECEPRDTPTCDSSCQSRPPECGDGLVTAPEECDGGNATPGDGCNASCRLEFCGDGVVNNDGAETCEPPGTTTCSNNCTDRAQRCGDGFVTSPEECDDGNVAGGDGCTAGCRVEFCGDGIVNDAGAEDCEPPGTALCNDDCQTRAPVCGDGFQTPPEQCEDGNLVDGDGCTASCVVELCGDGVVNNDGMEDCEPPGTTTCAEDCTLIAIFCGDGQVDEGEDCDDGNLADGDGCSSICELESSVDTDGGVPMDDGGVPSFPDSGVDGPGPSIDDGGGGCRVTEGQAPIDPFALLLLGFALHRRRRSIVSH